MGVKIKVGSRESALAVRQSRIVMDAIQKSSPGAELELVTLKTAGDRILSQSLDKIGGKGLFVKELEQALMSGAIDIAVHSYKDMPYEDQQDLPVVALSERASPFDALVLPQGAEGLDREKPVGSSSLRRSIQFARLYGGFELRPVRGNVHTRLSKLDGGGFSALILAEAGLDRLGLRGRISRVFTADEMIPSASQGILAVQGRAGGTYPYLEGFHSQEAETVSLAERQFLKTLGGGCTSPAAAYAVLHNSEIMLRGMYVDGSGNVETGSMAGEAGRARQLGERLALLLKERLENR